MKRYAFYLLAAFAAFAISLFAAAFFSLRQAERSENIGLERMTTAETLPNNAEETKIEKIEPEIKKEKFGCEDEALRTIWSKLEKDKAFIADAYPLIDARHITDCREFFSKEAADLNDDESEEIVVKGNQLLFCSSGGDTQIWIVSKISNTYRIILESKGGDLPEDLAILKGQTRNFQNLKVKIPHGWEADYYAFFEFDGKRYRMKKCQKDVNSDFIYNSSHDEKLISVKLKQCL